MKELICPHCGKPLPFTDSDLAARDAELAKERITMLTAVLRETQAELEHVRITLAQRSEEYARLLAETRKA